MKKTAFLTVCMTMGFIAGVRLSAQTAASVHWTCMPPDSQHVSSVSGNLSGVTQTSSPGFLARDYTNGPGPDQRWWPSADNKTGVSWGGETAQVEGRWVQFAATPNANFTFQADSMAIYLGGKGTDGVRVNLWYDTRADFSNPAAMNAGPLPMKKDGDSLYTFSLNALVQNGDTLYIRIYPWYAGGASTSKYLYMRQCTISGTTKGLTYPASAKWELTNPSAGGTGQTAAVTGQVTADDEKLVNMNINQYTGYNNSQRARIISAPGQYVWPANQTTQIDTVYIQFAVSPKTATQLKITSITLNIGAHSLSNMKANIWYSTDPEFKDPVQIPYATGDANNYLLNYTAPFTPVSAALNVLVHSGETFYLRVYPWVHAESSTKTGKYVTLQDAVIAGEIEGTPNPATALWPMEKDVTDNPVTTGSVTAKKQSYSPAMKWYGTTNLPNTAGADLVVGAVQTVSKTWYAEPLPSDSLYFQYAAAPKHGGTFFVNSVSMYLGGWFSNTIKAAVYCSKDSTFADKTLLIADTLLAGNAVMPLSAAPDETVETGETFYLRVYPHNTEAQGWAKLVAVDSVRISGTTMGVTADPPTVMTNEVTAISTTFATSGGNVSTDGGAPVTAKGVCWKPGATPTVADDKTADGAGSGSFTSRAAGLTAGASYRLRAYATNEAGTSYGEEKTFTTLDSISMPAVTTAAVTQILVKSAQSGGTVTAWGGEAVTARGICWNMTGSPTIADSKTENGKDLGAFTGTLFPLVQNTVYHVRAYATNGKGTGYGNVLTFTTQTPAPAVIKVVAKDGSGDYTTVQAAFNAVPDYYTGSYTIAVRAGTYKEKLLLAKGKTNVILKGDDPKTTILTYDDYAGIAGGTSLCYSTAIEADDFTAVDITFQNTVKNDGSKADQQAVALRTNGDRQSYYNCRLLGYQDTYYTWGGGNNGPGRTYMKNCFIEGSVDFIFGRSTVVFDSCEIHINREGGTLTAASTDAASQFGYVFLNSKITAEAVGFDGRAITTFVLGRPWQAAPRTVFIKCEEPAQLNPAGWSTWNVTPALYGEYKCTGAGARASGRISIGRQLTDEEAADYTLARIFAKTGNPVLGFDWMPEKPVFTSVETGAKTGPLPASYSLSQNYPNPFNPTTVIRYGLPAESRVRVTVHDVLGKRVMTLVDAMQNAGWHQAVVDAAPLASGVYFYRIEAGDFRQTRKMMLMK
jgi:pectin methylesterase-like acyl-CoA thioesterase